MKNLKRLQTTWIVVLAGALTALSGCTNTRIEDYAARYRTPSSNPSSSPSGTPAEDTYRISNVIVEAPSGGATSGTFTTTVFLDKDRSTGPITDSCNLATNSAVTSKPCFCEFSWYQINTTGTTTTNVPRIVRTALSNVNPYAVVCNAPSVYSNTTEMPEGTTLKVRIVVSPNAPNPSSFETNLYSYLKQGTVAAGSFQDEEGRAFDNVYRYACYEQFRRGMSLTNKIFRTTDPNTGKTADIRIASQFCVGKANSEGGGSGSTDSDCDNPGVDNSAQAYYYNLFIRNTDKGGINAGNARYKCPKVKETLAAISNPNAGNNYWPMDTSFALSHSPNEKFNIGVEAFSRTSQPGDQSTANSRCFSTGNGDDDDDSTSSNATLVRSCIGYAAKPAKDGSCPVLRDRDGRTRQTFRLRRFIAIYPPVYDTDGKMIDGLAQATDTIYVLDRPVRASIAADEKPYTMHGPKPCPFAFFDHKGVGTSHAAYPANPPYTYGMPSYIATNNSKWSGKNVDAIQFPNYDKPGEACGAAIPVIDSDKTMFGIATVHSQNPNASFQRIYVRPMNTWAPHYEEDTDFLACAPQADPLVDPPLHFKRDSVTGNVGYCAEVYPSQNQNLAHLDIKSAGLFVGRVVPYTSHVVKNSTSALCTATQISDFPSGYPAGGHARHLSVLTPGAPTADSFSNSPISPSCVSVGGTVAGATCNVYGDRTCDRTVMSGTEQWTKFPLLAPPADVESALASDSSYACTITYDAGNGKTGKYTPSGGCCGTAVKVRTAITTDPDTAHLEPRASTACQSPDY